MRFLKLVPFPLAICVGIFILVLVITQNKNMLYRSVLFVFFVYLIVLLELVFFPIPIPENWPHNLNWNDTRHALRGINRVPFYFPALHSSTPHPEIVVRDTIANIMLTLPAGLMFPYLARLTPVFSLVMALLTGFLFEGMELAVKLLTGTFYHIVDINDVIMNTFGFLLGYLVLLCIQWIVRWFSKQAEAIST